MPRSVPTIVVLCFLAVLAASSPSVSGQEKGVAPPAPVPAQIFTAKNVFISNGGLDGIALQMFRKLGDVDQPCKAFYAAIKECGKYEAPSGTEAMPRALVLSPAEADLVFEIRFHAPFNGDEHVPSYVPQFNLTIYDGKTGFVLWTMVAPVEGACRKDAFIRNINQGIGFLIADLKTLQGRSGIPPLTLQNRAWETRGPALVISFLAFIPHAKLATENGQSTAGFPFSFFGFLRNLELI